MKVLQKKLRLKQVGRKLFDTKQAISIKSFEIWPGFSTSFSISQGLTKPIGLLNIDLVHKVITNENVLEILETIKSKFPQNYETMIS